MDELYHYGVKGQKWGVRRYQNVDGTLTPAGRKRYYNEDGSLTAAGQKRVFKTVKYYDVKKGKKDPRARLGQAVGEDEMITEAARKLIPFAKKHGKDVARVSNAEHKLQEAYENERDRLYTKEEKKGKKWEDIDHKQLYETAYKNVDKRKERKEFDEASKQSEKSYKEYREASRKIAEDYLGKYANTKVSDLPNDRFNTAADTLRIQMEWGIGLGRVKDL